MKRFVALFVVAMLVCAPAARAQEDEEASYEATSPVVTATTASFDGVIKSAKVVFVEFYAPWCGHCKQLKPLYEEAATKAKAAGLDAKFVAVDATEEQTLGTKFEVSGYPSVKVFIDGELVSDYEGDRSAEGFIDHAEAALLPDVIEVDSQATFDRLFADKVHALGHFSKENEAAAKSFREACAAMRKTKGYSHVRCGEVTDKAVAQEKEMMATPSLKVTRTEAFHGDEEPVVEFDFFTDAGFNTEKITEFLLASSFAALAEISPANYQTYTGRGLPIVWLFHQGHGKGTVHGREGESEAPENTPEVDAEIAATLAVAREAAAGFAGKVSFVYLSGEDYGDHGEALGLSGGWPGCIIESPDGRYVFPRDTEWTVDSVKAFLGDFVAGKLEKHVKSEPVPSAEEQSGPVRKIVAKTFDDEVYASDKDVFVMFYAPWCGHCKAMKPAWERLGEMLKDKEGVVIAQMDAIANDVPEQIQGFPMLYLKKAADKEKRIDPNGFYDDGRTLPELLTFLQKNTAADLDDVHLPANVNRIKEFMAGFEDFRVEVKRLMQENRELKQRLGEDPDAGMDESFEPEDPYAEDDDEGYGGAYDDEAYGDEEGDVPAHDDL